MSVCENCNSRKGGKRLLSYQINKRREITIIILGLGILRIAFTLFLFDHALTFEARIIDSQLKLHIFESNTNYITFIE